MNSNEPGRLEASQCPVCETENSAVSWVRGSITGKKRHTHTQHSHMHTCEYTSCGFFIESSQRSHVEPCNARV